MDRERYRMLLTGGLGSGMFMVGLLGLPSQASQTEAALNFSLPSYRLSETSQLAVHSLEQTPADEMSELTTWQDWFVGGEASLVARAVGVAEGTRTVTGDRTTAYYGHRDPGNGVWNLGTFSYQHGAVSPEQADQVQLQRLYGQAAQLHDRATTYGLILTVNEALNGIDLANQAPLAALATDGGSYVDRLRQAREAGLPEEDAVLWARVYAYYDPKANRWDAAGLGNTVEAIRQDQQRRQQAIAAVLARYDKATDHENTASEFDSVASVKVGLTEPSVAITRDRVPLPLGERVPPVELILSERDRPFEAVGEGVLTSEQDQIFGDEGENSEAIAAQIVFQDLSRGH